MIKNDRDLVETPNCVAFNENAVLVGDAAASQAVRNSTNTIFNLKRLIGRKFSDF